MHGAVDYASQYRREDCCGFSQKSFAKNHRVRYNIGEFFHISLNRKRESFFRLLLVDIREAWV
jgi:hypothetical protein